MKVRKLYPLLLLILSNYCSYCLAQSDTTLKSEDENCKKNWTIGVLPATVYNSDVGFRYGAIVKLFNYGDGSGYPAYKDCIFLHWSKTTKGSATNEFIYDSEHLIPNIRSTFEFNYSTDLALDFYGYNGYKAYYNSDIENKNSSYYKSGLYYKMDRKMLRIRTDFQGKLKNKKVRWLAGLTFYHVKTDTVDLNTLNKGKNINNQYPGIQGGLFGAYMRSGLIPMNEIKDCHTSFVKLGLIFDTRDAETNPMKGIWSDIQIITAPGFLANDQKFIRISVTHRQYFPIIKNKLTLACRLSFQNKISGTVPFYMLPVIHYLSPYTDEDGLGGGKTLRGILLNRIVGDGIAYGNLELRWKFLKTILWKQNIYLALSGFIDGGMVTQNYKLQNSVNTSISEVYISKDREKPHMSAGAGFHLAINENFVISADYGQSLDRRDGLNGIYIGLDFLF